MQEPFGLEVHADRKPVSSIDPVCRMTVNEKEASGKTEYEGQTYYFCSADCQRAFEENPGKFAGLQR